MAANPKNKPKDQALFGSLQKAQKAGAVTVSVNAELLNRPGSPVWDSGENVAPLLAMLLIPVVFMFTFNLIVGTAMLVLSVFLYVGIIRPWILQRVHRRAMVMAMENVQNWTILWKKGGLSVALNSKNGSRCVSPAGDWRTFASRHFPHPSVDGTETYKTFNRAEDDGADARSIADLNM